MKKKTTQANKINKKHQTDTTTEKENNNKERQNKRTEQQTKQKQTSTRKTSHQHTVNSIIKQWKKHIMTPA